MSLETKTKPLFITIEGGEGVGKTTNVEYIKQLLNASGTEFIHTREPGGTPLAEELRELLLSKRGEQVDEMAELLLVFAARSQHLNTKILPALSRGEWVLCDRFTDATYAYQGCGRNMSTALIEQLEQTVQQGVQPDLTLLLDVPVEIGMERARQRGELDRFESEQLAFFHRVREGYLRRAADNPQRFAVIDASQPLADVQAQIAGVILPMLANTP
ncbi:Thymidylate kinase [Sinobacterium norvegicum]|uniref:Thymidylate kinase n=1 Tax=Sinobacterium norvegicum TaxID=1641715 RepID=A0ABN8EES5_9GAMM|nr:dTMP kinase [Sinobacterium norvegicum]CAH0990128.1 Thymidylate kinase [Sinobacterium norvegicum]